MKQFIRMLMVGATMLLLGLGLRLHAQNGPGCTQGAAIGQAHAALAACIAGNQQNLDVQYAAYPNIHGGYTVSVFAGRRCHPGEICPLFIMLIGSIETDANCNVISVNSRCQ